jgi:PAS domain S-box-containing protein
LVQEVTKVKNFKISMKMTLIFILFAILLLTSLGLITYQNARASLRAAAISELLATSIEKEAFLKEWVADNESTIQSIASQPHLQDTVSRLISFPKDDEPDSLVMTDIRTDLLNWTSENEHFISLQVIASRDGQVLISTSPNDEGKFRESAQYYLQALQGAYVENPFYDLTLGRNIMVVSAPVFTPEGSLLAVLAGTLDLDEVNTIIRRRSGLHRTDDTYLVNTSNLFITQPRLQPDATVLQSGVHTQAVTACLEHAKGVIEAPDYRDIPAIVVYRWLADRQICLITKIDQSEAYASSLALRDNILIAGVGILLAASLVAVFLSRSVTRPVLELTRAAGQISQGNLAVCIQEKTGDEIGELGRSFNQMAASILQKETELNRWAAELEERVETRTMELLESEERYRTLSETSPDMIFLIDRQDRVQYVNSMAAGMFGKIPAQVIGKPRTDLFPPAVAESQGISIQKVLEGDAALSAESEITFPGGRLWLDTQLVPILNNNNEIVAVMGVARDISERKLAEEKLNSLMNDLSRSNVELEHFAYVASHDLQEPLRMVTSYLQLLERRTRGKLDGEALEFIQYAVEGSSRMKMLITDLLVYSRVNSRGQELVRTNCEDVFVQALHNLKVSADESGARITHDPLPYVLADETQLEQLFQNLVGNAIKFKGDKSPQIHVGVEPKEGMWLFSVKDNGIGIEPQYFERIFILFQRLHGRDEYAGTGIGLAVCQRIVERHGGRIWVESTPGQGSTFFFTLPVARKIKELGV